jgi:glutathione peroxidase
MRCNLPPPSNELSLLNRVIVGQQEPESNSQILKFAKNKGVEFTMMEKVNVNGPNASLVYKYLKHQTGHDSIGWNFGKYRIRMY